MARYSPERKEAILQKMAPPQSMTVAELASQEEVLIAAREFLHLSLDDLMVVAHEFIHPTLSRSVLARMLKRRQVLTLAQLRKKDQENEPGSEPKHKPFKVYNPSFIHIDIKFLPQMPDQEQRRYLYVAIDRATR